MYAIESGSAKWSARNSPGILPEHSRAVSGVAKPPVGLEMHWPYCDENNELTEVNISSRWLTAW